MSFLLERPPFYRCELLVSESIFWWFLSLRRVMYIEPAWCFLLVLGSFLLTSLRGFPTNFLQMVLRWQPTGGQRKLTSTQSINQSQVANQASWPPNQSRECCCFVGTWNFIKFYGPQKTISLFCSTFGTLVMGLGDVWAGENIHVVPKLNASPWKKSHWIASCKHPQPASSRTGLDLSSSENHRRNWTCHMATLRISDWTRKKRANFWL